MSEGLVQFGLTAFVTAVRLILNGITAYYDSLESR